MTAKSLQQEQSLNKGNADQNPVFLNRQLA